MERSQLQRPAHHENFDLQRMGAHHVQEPDRCSESRRCLTPSAPWPQRKRVNGNSNRRHCVVRQCLEVEARGLVRPLRSSRPSREAASAWFRLNLNAEVELAPSRQAGTGSSDPCHHKNSAGFRFNPLRCCALTRGHPARFGVWAKIKRRWKMSVVCQPQRRRHSVSPSRSTS